MTYTILELVPILGKKPATIRNDIRTGRLSARFNGHRYIIKDGSLAPYWDRHRKALKARGEKIRKALARR